MRCSGGMTARDVIFPLLKMSEQLTPEELETLKERFRATGCTVTDLSDSTFEIIGWDTFPLRTHVSVNPYFLELGTLITAVTQGFLPNRISKILAFLNAINCKANLVKFTIDAEKPDAEAGGWFVMASVRFVTGVAGGDFDADAVKNLINLWFQDIAEVIRAESPFEIRAMLKKADKDSH